MTEKHRSTNLETEDYISMVTLVLVSITLIGLIVVFGKYSNIFKDLSFLGNMKLTNNKNLCAKYNDKFEQCVKAQQSGYGCSWYAGCSACVGAGLSGEEVCKNKGQVINKAEIKTSPESKPESIKDFVNCAQFNKNFEQCVKAQQSGYGCSWYAGCSACIEKNQQGQDVCESISSSSAKTQTPTVQKSASTQDCGGYNGDFEKCVKAQQSGEGCSWFSACKACINQGEKGEEVCKKTKDTITPIK